jgi:N6-adenosine-specific RNA methylase IME4
MTVRSYSEWNQRASEFIASGSVACPDCGAMLPANDDDARQAHYQNCGGAKSLSPVEQVRLDTLEAVVEGGLKVFFEVGTALLEIRDSRLYRQSYDTFEAYCRVRWNIKRQRAYELMAAAAVVENLSEISDKLPERESHAAAMTTLAPDEQQLVWQGGKVTEAHVRSVVNVLKEVTATGAIDDGSGAGIPVTQATTDHLKAAMTEETYERLKRQETYIEEKQARKEAGKAASDEAKRRAAETPLPAGKYRCIVIDPPWHVEKIDREVRPRQEHYLDYPTMTLEEISALPVAELADDDGCHLYLWTTQKYLPEALKLVDAWGFRYQCLMTWVKPTGITPYSWMYNTEHILFARRGSLPLLRNGLKLSIEAPVIGHSIKPDAFFERVLEASPEPRLEMFARRTHAGFAAWGNEVQS